MIWKYISLATLNLFSTRISLKLDGLPIPENIKYFDLNYILNFNIL